MFQLFRTFYKLQPPNLNFQPRVACSVAELSPHINLNHNLRVGKVVFQMLGVSPSCGTKPGHRAPSHSHTRRSFWSCYKSSIITGICLSIVLQARWIGSETWTVYNCAFHPPKERFPDIFLDREGRPGRIAHNTCHDDLTPKAVTPQKYKPGSLPGWAVEQNWFILSIAVVFFPPIFSSFWSLF